MCPPPCGSHDPGRVFHQGFHQGVGSTVPGGFASDQREQQAKFDADRADIASLSRSCIYGGAHSPVPTFVVEDVGRPGGGYVASVPTDSRRGRPSSIL